LLYPLGAEPFLIEALASSMQTRIWLPIIE
jgi:hypothetical protein